MKLSENAEILCLFLNLTNHLFKLSKVKNFSQKNAHIKVTITAMAEITSHIIIREFQFEFVFSKSMHAK